MSVTEGEVFGLLGPNGAGKTTLIKILSTLILPDEGSAFIDGFDVTKEVQRVKERIGYVVSEERSFYWRLTGRQNLKFFTVLSNLSSRETDKRIGEVVALTGLENDIDNVFQTYSSGMKQRLAIARGMLLDPQILLLDEPTRNLDPSAAQKIRTFIKTEIVGERRKTVIIATNNMQEAEQLCDRVAIIHNGRVKCCESIEGMRRTLDGGDCYVIEVRGTWEALSAVFSSLGFSKDIICHSQGLSSRKGPLTTIEIMAANKRMAAIVEKILTAGLNIEALYPKERSLDEIFSRIVE
jgi:ABC-2 type transport system ATP-binding protein